MKNLTQELDELERLYRLNKSKLVLAKILVIGLGVLSLCYAYYYLLMKAKRHHLQLVGIETIESMVLVALFILPSLLLIPLYKFFSDRVENKINWDIKMSIFEDVLNKYTSDYKISFKGILPNEDLQFLKLENGITKFAYGDDLIFGSINTSSFRLCEIHSINFLGKSFHGLVGVIFTNDVNATHQENPQQTTNHLNEIKNPTSSTTIIHNNGRHYLLKSNKKDLFEFHIKKDHVNKSSLLADHQFFALFMEELNALSQDSQQTFTKLNP
jgi:hypothetical protein